VRKFYLPSTEVIDAAWHDDPPDALDDPDLYDGMPWRRSAGYLIDLVVLVLLMGCAWIAFTLLSVLSLGLLLPIKIVALALLPVAYHTYFVGDSGATPGMRAMDVEVRTWTGRRPDFVQAFLMTVMFYATVALTSWLILVVALFNKRYRLAHDFLAGTLGVRHSRVSAANPLVA